MNSREHKETAEACLRTADGTLTRLTNLIERGGFAAPGLDESFRSIELLVSRAQVHATLATIPE